MTMAYPRLTDEPGAIESAALVSEGRASPSELARAAIARIEALDGAINAVVVRDFDRALAAAQAMDGKAPGRDQLLFGVPMTVKESFDIAGLPTTFGHLQFRDNIAARDSEVVRRLKAAGAVILGKTNVPPDLADLQSNNPVYGRTNNPHDNSRVAGGSSGGGAAAVAAGMVPCEYGSDIGSSIRNPAHFNGIYGHKPSFGLISRRGHAHPMAGGRDVHDGPLSVAGPLARSAEDLALLLGVTASRRLREKGRRMSDCRFLAVFEHPASEVDAAVLGPLEDAVRAIEDAGATVERSSPLLPDLAQMQADYMRLLNVAMARGRPGPGGQVASLADWFEMLDRQARTEYAFAALFEHYDFILAPPLAFLAYLHDDTPIRDRRIAINGKDSAFADTLSWAGLATYPNLPSTVVPVGGNGALPCGMQVIGPRWGDADCIAAAGAIGHMLHV